MRLLVAGDTHGNTRWVRDYLFPWAKNLRCDGIVQLGDFGYWEHEQSGAQYLDDLSALAVRHDIPLFWLRGNHDNIDLLRTRYASVEHRVEFGFWRIREGVMYIPDGCTFEWQGLRFRAFGGAYSVDKQWRLDLEAKHYRQACYREDARRKAGKPAQPVPSTAGTIWFPGEEMTDQEMADLLTAKVGAVDVILSHDKPRCTPNDGLKDLLECFPNQDRLQRALDHHKPSLWLHGHLHRHSDYITCTGTRVISLNCDDEAAGVGWRAANTFCLLDWDPIPASTTRSARPALQVISGAKALAELIIEDREQDAA